MSKCLQFKWVAVTSHYVNTTATQPRHTLTTTDERSTFFEVPNKDRVTVRTFQIWRKFKRAKIRWSRWPGDDTQSWALQYSVWDLTPSYPQIDRSWADWDSVACREHATMHTLLNCETSRRHSHKRSCLDSGASDDKTWMNSTQHGWFCKLQMQILHRYGVF